MVSPVWVTNVRALSVVPLILVIVFGRYFDHLISYSSLILLTMIALAVVHALLRLRYPH